MVTVLSIKEYEKLLIEGQLTYSSNVDFIRSHDLKLAIKQFLSDISEGLIALVASNNSSHYQNILKKTNPLNAILPKPKSPVYLKLKSNPYGIGISPDVLYTVEDFNLEDGQIRNFLRSFFHDDITNVCYYFVPILNKHQIAEESYDDALADEMYRIKQKAIDYDILYKPLSLF